MNLAATPLEAALAKLGEARQAEFIAACGKMPRHQGYRRDHARERAKTFFKLSWQDMTELEKHFAAAIKAWPNVPAPRIAQGRSALPPRDRE